MLLIDSKKNLTITFDVYEVKLPLPLNPSLKYLVFKFKYLQRRKQLQSHFLMQSVTFTKASGQDTTFYLLKYNPSICCGRISVINWLIKFFFHSTPIRVNFRKWEWVVSNVVKNLFNNVVFKKKIDKRGRKLVDFDSQRHNFQALQTSMSKKRDDAKIAKAREHLEEAKRTYEMLNSELHDELPALYDSRILFLVTNLQSLFNSEQVFHSETSKVRCVCFWWKKHFCFVWLCGRSEIAGCLCVFLAKILK